MSYALEAQGLALGTGYNRFRILNGVHSFNRLANGTVLIPISNTSANPIAGTFTNLPDNSTFTAGRSNYQVNYVGGDGNDLTLTVVP